MSKGNAYAGEETRGQITPTAYGGDIGVVARFWAPFSVAWANDSHGPGANDTCFARAGASEEVQSRDEVLLENGIGFWFHRRRRYDLLETMMQYDLAYELGE